MTRPRLSAAAARRIALAAQGFAPIVGSAEDFDKFYRAERDKWAKVVTSAGMDKD